jgi:DNA modification methylase
MIDIRNGDALDVLRELPNDYVQTVVTSPPYWGLRDYGVAGQIGLEATPAEYVARLVAVFDEVRRVLRHDGTLWLNLGDSYAAGKAGRTDHSTNDPTVKLCGNSAGAVQPGNVIPRKVPAGLKEKDLVGIPWRVAFALQDAGWYLRQDIIWHKPNPMPESVRDRCTKAHEYLFLFAKSPRYFFDAEAVKEPADTAGKPGGFTGCQAIGRGVKPSGNQIPEKSAAYVRPAGRNKRSVWTIPPKPYKGAHFACFPPALVEPCILAGTSERGTCARCGAPYRRIVEKTRTTTRPGADTKVTGDKMTDGNRDPQRHVTETKILGFEPSCWCPEVTAAPVPCIVLDPFAGSGTVGEVCRRHGRRFVGIELNPAYIPLIDERVS